MSTMPAVTPGGNGSGEWQVTDATQTVGQDSTGRYTKGWQVTFQIGTGHTGMVFVPGDLLNPAQVQAAVAKQADALYGVVGLTSRS